MGQQSLHSRSTWRPPGPDALKGQLNLCLRGRRPKLHPNWQECLIPSHQLKTVRQGAPGQPLNMPESTGSKSRMLHRQA